MIPNVLIDYEHIRDSFWRYSHATGYIASEVLTFLPNGKVGGYGHDNEKCWKIDNGVLLFLNNHGNETVRFTNVKIESGLLCLTGRHIPNPIIILQLHQHRSRMRYGTTQVDLAAEIAARGWSVGNHTYGTPKFYEPHLARFSVGKYCSIADGVRVALGDHRMDTISTYPFATLRKFWQQVPAEVKDHSSKGDVVIGNDVWIGVDVFIGSGVDIGSGAVIGAKSIVTKMFLPMRSWSAIQPGSPAIDSIR